VPRKKQHYVDNSKLLEVMSEYREQYLIAKDNDIEPPVIPDYAGECFLKIAEKLSHRPNFINYAFREEMVSDGIENCVMYANNFNPEKSQNPFAYFTQIIYYAFLRRIEKENSDTSSMESEDFISTGASPLTADKRATIYDFIYAFEEKKRKKKKPKETVDTKLAKMSPLTTYLNEELPA